MTRYHVEYYCNTTGNMICWYSTGSKTEAEKQADTQIKGLKVIMKEVHHA